MPLSGAVRELARDVRAFWGARGSQWRVDSSRESVSFVVYDAFLVQVDPADGALRVRAHEIGGRAFRADEEIIDHGSLPDLFTRLDERFRAALPPAFLRRFDAWVREGRELHAAGSGLSTRAPGRTVTAGDIESAIDGHWGTHARIVDRTDEDGVSVRARIDDRIDVVITREAPHDQLGAAIVLGNGAETTFFGTWMTADHPDAEGLAGILRQLDAWVRLRLGEAPAEHRDGARPGV